MTSATPQIMTTKPASWHRKCRPSTSGPSKAKTSKTAISNVYNDSFSVLNPAVINLIADDTFKDVTLALKENDQIHFVAKFDAYKIVAPSISVDFKLISVRRSDNGFEERILSHSSKESNQILLLKMKDNSVQAQTSTIWSKITNAVMFTISLWDIESTTPFMNSEL
uniref:Wolframin OB-fold domain-containing protein n=1 Tax=Romanomermis culicivorax TaxID=13658 RepID=A0A915HK12_ROMCU